MLAGIGYTKVGLMTWEDARFVATIKTDPEGMATGLSMFHKETKMLRETEFVPDEEHGHDENPHR